MTSRSSQGAKRIAGLVTLPDFACVPSRLRRQHGMAPNLPLRGEPVPDPIGDKKSRQRFREGVCRMSLLSSWPDLFRPSTSLFHQCRKGVDHRDKPGDDGSGRGGYDLSPSVLY